MYKYLFKIGQFFRNPSLQSHYEFLKASEKWSLEELQEYQLKKLQEIVTLAYHHSSFYKRKMNALGVLPEDIVSFDAIKKLPIISKKELINFNAEIHTALKFKKSFTAATSGTSGEALVFKREEQADSFNRASIFRGYSWYNVRPWESNIYFWGFNFSTFSKIKVSFLDWMQHRRRVFDYSQKSLVNTISKLKNASYLHGYSSMIYEMAKQKNRLFPKDFIHLKMVKGTSEKIIESYQEEIKNAFGVKMISEYGAAETGIIAFECTHGVMHINMEGVLVEEINNEIVVTNLQQKSFPIIRYKLGDYIAISKDKIKCKCGLNHTILNEVTGRIGAVVYGVEETYPSLYFYYIFKNLVNKYQLYVNYQVVQHEKGVLEFFIEQQLTSKEIEQLKTEINTYFKSDINFTIKTSSKFKTISKKQQSFISTI